MVNEHGADAVVDVAERHGARMIVAGTHGESPLQGAILGSTAHRLVQIAERPVLVVHREAKA
jgi:nucleotide-binding universal stress UspA family protein